VGEEAGLTPDRLIRTILMGDGDEALNNMLVWKCVACYTCGVRCPNGIHTSSINETLKQMSKEAHLEPALRGVAAFHGAFTASASRSGRLNELEFMRTYEKENIMNGLKSGGFRAVFEEIAGQAGLGLSMLMRKRIHLGGEKIAGLSEIRRIFKKAGEKYAGRSGRGDSGAKGAKGTRE
jgi:heterodisulfide reductase subunit C